MTDLHLHTLLSFDSEELPENYIKAAEKLGATRLGFSEHYDFDVISEGGERSLADPDGIFSTAERLQKTTEVRILKGIEFGYVKGALPRYKEILSSYPFDYSILSVHTIAGRGDCYFPRFFSGFSKREAYKNYFSAVLESVSADLDYKIVGHVGYVCRNSPYDDKKIIYAEFSDILDSILKEIISRGVCLEINTSTGKSGARFIPDIDVIERFLSLGGKFMTFGSDAHHAARLLDKEGEVKNFLLKSGVDSLYYFVNGEKIAEKL